MRREGPVDVELTPLETEKVAGLAVDTLLEIGECLQLSFLFEDLLSLLVFHVLLVELGLGRWEVCLEKKQKVLRKKGKTLEGKM